MITKTDLIRIALDCGAAKAAVIEMEQVPFDRSFRAACEVNSCGNYGQCWTCPPFVGDIDELIAQAKAYRSALVYQTISDIEDSFDIEGMLEGGKRHNQVTLQVIDQIDGVSPGDVLHLSAGGCRICERCAKRDDMPCRFPQRALASLEAYGIAVSRLAELCGMKYINGVNTVTYFGMTLFRSAIE